MKSFSAFILKVDNFEDEIQNIIVDSIIEAYAKDNLRNDNGNFDITIDNENKTYILFVNYTLGAKALNVMRKKLIELDFGKPAIIQFEDITEELLHTNKYHQYTNSCDRAKAFIFQNLEVDSVLEKIMSEGINSLTEVEKQILAA